MGLFALTLRLFSLGAGRRHWALWCHFAVPKQFPGKTAGSQTCTYISEVLGYFQVRQLQIPSLPTPLPFCFKTLFGLKVQLVVLFSSSGGRALHWEEVGSMQPGAGGWGGCPYWGTLALAFRAIWDCRTDCVILPQTGPISR